MLRLDPWRFASPGRAAYLVGSRRIRLTRPRRHPLVRRLPLRSKPLQPRLSPLASGCLLWSRSPLVRSHSCGKRRPKLARHAKAGRAQSKRACWRCWAGRREQRLAPSSARPIGSSTRSAASSLLWCAKSLALICARRKPTVPGSMHRPPPHCPFGVPALTSPRSLSVMARVVIDPAVPDQGSLDNEIARLRGLDVGHLRARWHTVFRRRAPPHLPRHLLFRILAYQLQADRLGDLDVDSRRLLDRIGSGASAETDRPVADFKRRSEVR